MFVLIDPHIVGNKYTKLEMVGLNEKTMSNLAELDKTLAEMGMCSSSPRYLGVYEFEFYTAVVESKKQGKNSKKIAKKIVSLCQQALYFATPASTASNNAQAIVGSIKVCDRSSVYCTEKRANWRLGPS
jgi:hypothetical protein